MLSVHAWHSQHCSLFSPPLGHSRVGLSVSRRVFLNELTDFGRGSDDITGTASVAASRVEMCCQVDSRCCKTLLEQEPESRNQKRGSCEWPGPCSGIKSKSNPAAFTLPYHAHLLNPASNSISDFLTATFPAFSLHPTFYFHIIRYYGCL